MVCVIKFDFGAWHVLEASGAAAPQSTTRLTEWVEVTYVLAKNLEDFLLLIHRSFGRKDLNALID